MSVCADMPNQRRVPPAFASPCVHLGAQYGAFTTHATSARPRAAFALRRRVARAHLPRASAAPGAAAPAGDAAGDAPGRNAKRWAILRRAAAASAVSVSVLFCALRGASAAGSAASGVHVPRDAAGEVEAAAMTLGAVTVGGLVMRAVLASRRDEDKEREKLAAECARLEEEETLRARRLQRKAMERVESADALPADDTLQNSLLKRMQDIDEGETDTPDQDADKKFMRNSPIPDRAAGSMLLDRPDDAAFESPVKDEGADADKKNPEELEMLNRMWNLNSPDSDDRTA